MGSAAGAGVSSAIDDDNCFMRNATNRGKARMVFLKVDVLLCAAE